MAWSKSYLMNLEHARTEGNKWPPGDAQTAPRWARRWPGRYAPMP